MHADGLTVNPKNAKPNGGWQILSIDMSATNTLVNGLGPMDANAGETDCGGQNYAEVIFFSEKPTTVERAACEQEAALARYTPGTRVTHPAFGTGVVESCTSSGASSRIAVRFAAGTKLLGAAWVIANCAPVGNEACA
jgi:hypothetical protein